MPGREGDRFGLDSYDQSHSDERLGLLTEDDEQGLEAVYTLAYTLALLPSFDLTADLQAIGGGVKSVDTAVIGALRGRIRF